MAIVEPIKLILNELFPGGLLKGLERRIIETANLNKDECTRFQNPDDLKTGVLKINKVPQEINQDSLTKIITGFYKEKGYKINNMRGSTIEVSKGRRSFIIYLQEIFEQYEIKIINSPYAFL